MGDTEAPAPDEDTEGPAPPDGAEEDSSGERSTRFLRTLGLPAGDFPGQVEDAVTDALAAPASGAPAWTPLGPRNLSGAVRSLVQDPSTPTTIYAGTSGGGAWKSVDDGLSWRPLGLPGNVFPINTLALAPFDTRIVLMGTGETRTVDIGGNGLFISTDGGESLVRVVPAATPTPGPGRANHYKRIAVDPQATALLGAGQITVVGTTVTGDANTAFLAFFKEGDVIKIDDEIRVVVQRASNQALTLDRALAHDRTAPTAYKRATPRYWVACETGLWRFDPGRGFQAEGPFPPVAGGAGIVSPDTSDVALAEQGPQVILYAGLQATGVWRGVFNRPAANAAPAATVWTQCALRRFAAPHPIIPAGQIGRIRLTLSRTTPVNVFAVAENLGALPGPNGHPTHVYHSLFTTNFTRRGRPYNPAVESTGALCDYACAFEVSPSNPLHLVFGSTNLHFSPDGGTTWRRIVLWTRNDEGDLAQHGDHHAAFFDARNPVRLWVAQDAGISLTADVTRVTTNNDLWRRRSYGLSASQPYSIRSHPTLPFITASGLQDNGTHVSYGGLTWYHVAGGDGGPTGFAPDPRGFVSTWSDGIMRTTVGAGTFVAQFLPDVAAGTRLRATQAFPLTDHALPGTWWTPVLDQHPTAANEMLIGRERHVRRSINGTTFPAMAAELAPAGQVITAFSFVPGQPSTVFWFGTNAGDVLRSGSHATVSPPLGGQPVHAIRVTNAGAGILRVAVCTVAAPPANGQVFLADVQGAAPVQWTNISAGLPRGSFTALAFDPANPTTLFVGTMAGVFGTTGLPAPPLASPPPAATAVPWQTHNAGLPLALVHDLQVSAVTGLLRCATYGRGSFERSLASTPAPFQVPPVRLLIRDHVMEDGRPYAGANTFPNDPRRAGNHAIDPLHSPDIRVDAPRFIVSEVVGFGESVDGAEFDESDIMIHDAPVVGDVNNVQVQVQNRGHSVAQDVAVHLYFAPTAVANAAPDFQAGFRAAFPNDPPAGTWQRATPPVVVGRLDPGTPAVVKFAWTPPAELVGQVALMAIATHPQDAVDLTPLPDVALTAATQERRIALRVTPVVANPLYLRDGLDDDGGRASVAWGGRSPDIVVLAAAPPANPHTQAAFSDLSDARAGDRVRVGAANQIMVRVFNRSALAVTADVNLYFVPAGQLDHPAQWARINENAAHVTTNMRTPAIPARSWRFTNAVPWTAPDNRAYLLVAIASPVTNNPPKPDHTVDANPDVGAGFTLNRLETFWRFVREGVFADKVATRALRKA